MSEPLETRYRLMGLLPLTFFAVQAIHYWRFGGMGPADGRFELVCS